MKKIIFVPYFLGLLPFLISIFSFCLFQVFHHGFIDGLYLTFLAWSMYVICIPAAHGRLFLAVPIKLLFKKKIFPEPFLWIVAVAFNIVTIIFDSAFYLESIVTHLLYRIIIMPEYWIILIIAIIGAWYRIICGYNRYYKYEQYHTLIRHIILLFGLFVFYYLTNNDFIIMMNAIATG